MKKLTKEQKCVIHGGVSVSGIISGIGMILYSVASTINLVSDHLFPEKPNNYREYQPKEPKIFVNNIDSKTTIIS